MKRAKTDWIEVDKLISSIISDMENTPKLMSDIKAEISRSTIPAITKTKLLRYVKVGVDRGAFVEDSKLGYYIINSIDDNFFKVKNIREFCKTGKFPVIEPKPLEPEVKVVIKDEIMEFPLRSKVYFVDKNRFVEGTVVGALFIDSDNEEMLAYLVKHEEEPGNIVTRQFFSSDIFGSIAQCANDMIHKFKERYPDYGKING